MSNITRRTYKSSKILEKTNDSITNKTKNFSYKGDGNILTINLQDIEEKVEFLRKNHSLVIKNLPEDIKSIFNQMMNYVNTLYETDVYNNIYEIVVKHFKDCDNVVPGTIAGYFAGCMVETDFTKSTRDNAPGCSLLCASALPKPKSDGEFSFCNYLIIFAKYDNDKYSFSLENNSDEKTKAIIYLNCSSEKEFLGFSEDEKKLLSNTGIEVLKFFGYNDKNPGQYSDIFKGPIKLSDVKVRRKSNIKKAKNAVDDQTNTMLVIFAILFVLALIFGIWRMRILSF